MQFDITASIVLYKSDPEVVGEAIDSFLKCTRPCRLYLLDNSPTEKLRSLAKDERVEYVFNNGNVGFGKAHNVALKKSVTNSKYHLVLNPDVYFEAGVLEELFDFMEQRPEVGQIMPRILYPDGEVQYSGKLLPAPIDLIARRVFPGWNYFRKKNNMYELRDSGYNRIMNIPQHLGCFLFIRTSVFPAVGYFDEDMFMYMEDIDLTRRIHMRYQTLFYPGVHVYHHYEQGSKQSSRLLKYHIDSTITYFNKWGWLFDSERKNLNKKAIKQYS
jgi:GT2 family glycosyltransferase